MAICKINFNKELAGIELVFDSKPSKNVIDEVKAHGFKWSPKKKLWYAKDTTERRTFADSIGTIGESFPLVESKAESINLDNLGGETCLTRSLWGADLAKAIREDLKKRGVKGCTVRAGKATYTTTITVTIKADSNDFASLEEAAERFTMSDFLCLIERRDMCLDGHWYNFTELQGMTEEEKESLYYNYLAYAINHKNDFSRYHQERENYWELTTDFYNKCLAVFRIANQWNYDNSDSMTDYFDVGYYLDIDIKHDSIEPRNTMTDRERTQLEEERAKEEADFKAWQEEQEKQRQENEKARIEHEKYINESYDLIYDSVRIEDLEESEQIYISNVVGGIGKECNIQELMDDITNDHSHVNDALITRKVIFEDSEIFNRFTNMLLNDFDFLAGKGGTGSEDVRLTDENIHLLNSKQRESIKFFCTNCVGIYLNDVLMLAIDPQGYNYARYTYIVNNDSIESSAPLKLAELRKESEALRPFYFPAPIEEQIKSLNIGDSITVWQCDGWLLNKVLDGFGIIEDIKQGDYAQYKGYFITLNSGKGLKDVFIRDNHECLIYKGVNYTLPDVVKKRRINDHMSELYNYDVLIPNIYDYFKAQGLTPVVDTWQR